MFKFLRVVTLVLIVSVIAGLALAAFNFITPAHARVITVTVSMQCYLGNYVTMQEDFLKQYNEIPLLRGVIENERGLMYLFRSSENDKWTFVYLGINGVYCIPFYGDGLVLIRGKGKIHAETY